MATAINDIMFMCLLLQCQKLQ